MELKKKVEKCLVGSIYKLNQRYCSKFTAGHLFFFFYFFSISNEGLTSKVKLSLLMRHCWSFVSLGHSKLCIYCNLQHLIEKGQRRLHSIFTWQREEKWKQFICTNLNNSSQSPFLYLRIDNSCILAHSQSFQNCSSRASMKAVMMLTDSMNPGVKIKPFTPSPSLTTGNRSCL